MLKEEDYVEKIRWFLHSARKLPEYRRDVCNWWETIVKPGVKKVSIDYCRQRSQWKAATTSFYETCLAEFRQMAKVERLKCPDFKSIQQEAYRVRMTQQYGNIIRGIMHSRIPKEEPSAYHVKRELKKQSDSTVNQLRDSSGELTTNEREIGEIIRSYFEKLMSEEVKTDPRRDSDFIAKSQQHSLTQDQNQAISNPFNASEVKTAINTSKPQKSPGVDGIPAEFYKTFSNDLTSDLVLVFNEIVQRKQLTTTQKQAIIKLIPKSKTCEKTEDYRPICFCAPIIKS